jgi:hypothetical protein
MRIIETGGRVRPSRGAGWLIACVVLASVASVVLGAAAPKAAADSPATAVLDWNKHALDALANAPTAPTPGAGMAPPVQALHLAMVQGAVYDAVNSIAGGYEPYLDVPSTSGSASQAAAAATAAHDVLVEVLNQAPLSTTFTAAVRQAIIDRLNLRESEAIAAATAADGAAAVADGIEAGEGAAAAMVGARAGDGRWGPFRFTCGEAPGQWRPITSTACTTPSGPSDPFAWAAKVKPFVVESNEQFLSEGPPALNTGEYAKEYNEVKSLGAVGSARSADQQALVDFFQANPVEMHYRSFRTVAQAQGERRHVHQLLGEQGALEQLASADGDPPRRRRRQPQDRRRRHLDVCDFQPAVWGHGLRLQLLDRVVHGGSRALLRAGTHELHARPSDRDDPRLPALP